MPTRLLLVLLTLFVLSCAMFMTLGARGDWGFVLAFRGGKLIALVLVAVSVSTATVLFQTVSNTNVLTPSIMGFDALYGLLVTGTVFLFGARSYLQLDETYLFVLNTTAMMGAAMVLFGTLLTQVRHDLQRMILTGIILNVLLGSLTGFMQRLIDPNDFTVVQVNSYARFTRVNTDLLQVAAILLIPALALTWSLRRRFDIIGLGRDAAISLGESHWGMTFVTLSLIALLVSISTALVGPVAFLGLLVVSVARTLTPSPYHTALLPVAALISAILLVAGQAIMERVLHMMTPLTVVIDFVGGILFLVLLLKGRR